MLRHFYNNIRHRARKVSASENKQRYLNEVVNDPNSRSDAVYENLSVVVAEDENLPMESSNNGDRNTEMESLASENTLTELKNKWNDEKKNIKKTGGGTFISILREADHQILSILDDQIHPDENPYDEAAEYFGETIEVQTSNEEKLNPGSEQKPLHTPRHKVAATKLPPQSYTVTSSKKKVLKPECIKKKKYFKKKINLTFYKKKKKTTEMLKFRNE